MDAPSPTSTRPVSGLDRRALGVGLGAILLAFGIYALSSYQFDAGHPDFFYLADAFLHGRTWLDRPFGPFDAVIVGTRVYVPFAPFPAIAVMPLVALVGPVTADRWEQIIGSAMAAIDVGLCWWLVGRIGVRSIRDRLWLVALFGFSTALWWVTTRGGVWHTGHQVALMVTLAALIESFGRRRPLLLGLLLGAAFLSRAPLAFAAPFFAWVVIDADEGRGFRAWPWTDLVVYAVGVSPAVLFALWYNAVRFGSPLESGYALASLPAFLEAQRQMGLFSTAHLAMNFDLLFTHLPTFSSTPPFLKPDGLGMSIFITSPGLLLALRADWRSRMAIALGLTTVAVTVPSLLYYGGGWLQYGYRYALDAIPFVMALVGLAIARSGLPAWGKVLIVVGVVVNLLGVYWAYNI